MATSTLQPGEKETLNIMLREKMFNKYEKHKYKVKYGIDHKKSLKIRMRMFFYVYNEIYRKVGTIMKQSLKHA